MSVGENIRRFRKEKALSQDQLASLVGVTGQTISKWETGVSRPNGEMLIPISRALEISLDILLDNTEMISMMDLSRHIGIHLSNTEPNECFHVAREMAWQIQRGLLCSLFGYNHPYDADEIHTLKHPSYILSDGGFSMVSNGQEPFFALFPQPQEGFGVFADRKDDIREIFAKLSKEEQMNAVLYLLRCPFDYLFEGVVLAEKCGIADDRIESVITDLQELQLVKRQDMSINGRNRVLYRYKANHRLIALFLIAQEVGYEGSYSVTGRMRKKPLLKS